MVSDFSGTRPQKDIGSSFSTPHITSRRKLDASGSGFCEPSPVDSLKTPACLIVPNADNGQTRLRSVDEIPASFREVFDFPYFNMVQSVVLDDVLYRDVPLVVSAPTGAGKTVIFELAIIRLLNKFGQIKKNWKIVYVAPVKALCSERYLDWRKKFQPYGLSCFELTGDTEMDELSGLHTANLILTTPEKWDSMSRKWKDNRSLFQTISLFLIDEIHILNDSTRGSTVEAVVSRMKILRLTERATDRPLMRFVGVSATIPNIEDIATWLGNPENPATSFKFGEKYRPVRLQKIVVGYPFKPGSSDFRFDMTLAYRLKSIIETYSNNKPSLVFCSSRKSVEQSADILRKELCGRSLVKPKFREMVHKTCQLIRETKIADMVRVGIGVHHAGLSTADRRHVEELFRNAMLPVLVSTSTLAMGVNLPAHLVVIKSTVFYSMGSPTEYSDSQVLQMIGRAGRPQYDTSATAVIMTKSDTKSKYENLMNGTQRIESSLHKHLIEHLNAEVVLHTITDMALAVEWIRHTFLYVCIMQNPTHYGYPTGLDRKQVEKRLEDLCLQNLNKLTDLKLVTMDEETFAILPTETGKLMARYCIAFETMKTFDSVRGEETIKDMLDLMVSCSEFDEFVQLRNNEKATLNALNKNKNKPTIRYPLTGRIKTKQMKTNCLMQAQFGCLPIQDFSLSQDVLKIFRVAQRVSKCLMEFLWQRKDYRALLTAIELFKSTKTKLWVDTKYVAKQLEGIGPTMSLSLVNAGLTTFQKLEQTNPREIELIVNRHPPFGNQVRDAVAVLPKYEMSIEQITPYKTNTCVLVISINLANKETIQTKKGSTDHQSVLLIGDQDNHIVFKWRIIDSQILRDEVWKRRIDVTRSSAGPELYVHLISVQYVGLDIHTTYSPVYQWCHEHTQMTSHLSGGAVIKCPQGQQPQLRLSAQTGQCNHKCHNKAQCGHKCCKEDFQTLASQVPSRNQSVATPARCHNQKGVDAQIRMLKSKASSLDLMSGESKRKKKYDMGLGLQQYAYQKPPSMRIYDQHNKPQQAPAHSIPEPQQRHQPFNSGTILGNIPVLKYGVGGRRIDPGLRQDTNIDNNSLYQDLNAEEWQNNSDVNTVQYGLAQFDNDDGSISMQYSCPNNGCMDAWNDSESPAFLRGPAPNQQRGCATAWMLGSSCNPDSTGELDDNWDSVSIQQVPSAQQSRNQSPTHISCHDDWAELHMYQKERETLGQEMYDIDPDGFSPESFTSDDLQELDRHSNLQTEDTRLTESCPTRNSCLQLQTYGRPVLQQTQYRNGGSVKKDGQEHLSHHGVDEVKNYTGDFPTSQSSDDELFHIGEILPRQDCDIQQPTNYTPKTLHVYGKLRTGNSPVPTGPDHAPCADKLPLGQKTPPYSPYEQPSKSRKHSFGQVVAWVADSDSSPCSQKSIPRSRTPLVKKSNLMVDFQKR
ncbi:probable ATP-dependent DNA helicase HFM1 [Haliotis asinina]|uniref:probable ATP-dependent DNA helicase HFM1 n=1 Tax=Haliotis asinina TaxID=109174 RepID=UPI00353262EA